MKRTHNKAPRNLYTYSLAAWAAIMAGMFVLAAGQVGCSTIAGGLTGAVHGLADDLDGLTDKLAKDKRDREDIRGY